LVQTGVRDLPPVVPGGMGESEWVHGAGTSSCANGQRPWSGVRRSARPLGLYDAGLTLTPARTAGKPQRDPGTIPCTAHPAQGVGQGADFQRVSGLKTLDQRLTIGVVRETGCPGTQRQSH
jgi:hypothetical protein